MTFDMAQFVEVRRLLEEIEPLEGDLLPNELELVRSLRAKYQEPAHGDFEDATCLEVIRRNVEVRKGFRFDPRRDPAKVIRVSPETGRFEAADGESDTARTPGQNRRSDET